MELDPLALATVCLVLLAGLVFVTVCYVGAQRKIDEQEREIAILNRLGRNLYNYVKGDLVQGKTGFSFYGNTRSLRPFETWRNANLDGAHVLVRSWEERHTHEDVDTVPIYQPRGLDPNSLDAIGQAATEYQPKVPEAWRDLDPKQEGEFE